MEMGLPAEPLLGMPRTCHTIDATAAWRPIDSQTRAEIGPEPEHMAPLAETLGRPFCLGSLTMRLMGARKGASGWKGGYANLDTCG